MLPPIKTYLKQIEDNLRAGNATEHTHRPALKALLEALDPTVTATNEPKRIACGAPDFVVARGGFTAGYVEAKDVGVSLADTERGDQLKRYRRALGNLLLTDQLEFRWYVGGEWRQTVTLGRWEGGRLRPQSGGPEALTGLIDLFMAHRPEDITTPRDLAERMARLTHMIRDIIVEAFNTENASSLLRGWRDAFARVLIADLNLPEKTPEFADMFAQTLAYGLFTARVMDDTPKTFTRQEAQTLIPKSNPFLRDFFYQISGPQLDDEPFGVFVDDLVNTLAHTDMDRVLAEFGKRTRQEDPVVHFYETFLAAYDPRLRESRGVYYTPEPVVSYIVRSVDHLLKTRFNLPGGLADTGKITVPNRDPGKTVKGKNAPRKTSESHRVLVLDPATGTGTFLYAVIDHIREQFMERGDAGLWPGYVRDHLLPRLFGFELLMAPYAVAHFKLSLQLAGRDLPENIRDKWAYIPEAGERLGVYLTNTLEAPHEMSGLPLFTQWVADESNAANAIKTELPVLVVMGNPPYSVSSSNKSKWIERLMESYKQAVRDERNIQPLSDDYIKFIRFAQDRIERTQNGIVAFITNHAYLSGLVHRGMREELLKAFTHIFVLNLHGSTLIGNTAPDGIADANVFDIKQGVAIALFVRTPDSGSTGKIEYFDLWGDRSSKYSFLAANDVSTLDWQHLNPEAPHFFFVPKNLDLHVEYDEMQSTANIFPLHSSGFATHRDHYAISHTVEALENRIIEFRNSSISDENIRQQNDLKDTRDWKLPLARRALGRVSDWRTNITRCYYRPFDVRYVYLASEIVEYPRLSVMRHFLKSNFGLIATRMIKGEEPNHAFVTRYPTEKIGLSPKTSNNAFVFPLYVYPVENVIDQSNLLEAASWRSDPSNSNRTPNLSPTFIAALEAKLNLRFNPIQRDAAEGEFGPEDVFHYIYAVLHSPTYRERYAEFLKIDFPRVPLTADPVLFRALAALGRELVALHLLESPDVLTPITRYPVPGDNRVEKGYPKYTIETGFFPKNPVSKAGRVWINPTQYFEGVPPDVWEFHVGGYQVLDKWLKDRRGRQLSYDDLTHYRRVVVALGRTMQLMDEIDDAVPAWPIA